MWLQRFLKGNICTHYKKKKKKKKKKKPYLISEIKNKF